MDLDFTNKISFGLFGHGKNAQKAIVDFHNFHKGMKEYYAESDKKLPACIDIAFENATKM